jgi:hypothetical protein
MKMAKKEKKLNMSHLHIDFFFLVRYLDTKGISFFLLLHINVNLIYDVDNN